METKPNKFEVEILIDAEWLRRNARTFPEGSDQQTKLLDEAAALEANIQDVDILLNRAAILREVLIG